MPYLFQMVTTLGAIALIVYLLKDQDLDDYESRRGQTYLERKINRYFVQNNYYYEGVNVQSQSMPEITYRQIIDWFVQRKQFKNAHRDTIAFTLKQPEGNQWVIFQGFFNVKTEELLAGRKLLGYHIDPELEEIHQGKALVIYE